MDDNKMLRIVSHGAMYEMDDEDFCGPFYVKMAVGGRKIRVEDLTKEERDGFLVTIDAAERCAELERMLRQCGIVTRYSRWSQGETP